MRQFVATALTIPLLVGCADASAGLPPRPDGPISDLAAIIPDGREALLDGKLRAYYEANCIAVIVASTPSLEGSAIEQYANSMANTWEVSDPGVLVLVAPAEGQVRLEVSRAANRILFNSAASRIISEEFLPEFRAGRLAEGTIRGTEAVMSFFDAGRDHDGLDRTACHTRKTAN